MELKQRENMPCLNINQTGGQSDGTETLDTCLLFKGRKVSGARHTLGNTPPPPQKNTEAPSLSQRATLACSVSMLSSGVIMRGWSWEQGQAHLGSAAPFSGQRQTLVAG